jgi:DNA-binding XRE family transcriptional regulator
MTQLQTHPPSVDPHAVRAALALSRERMARLLDVSWKTVERIEAEGRLPASAAAAARLAQVQQIVELGLTVYTREGFARFVSTPLSSFGGLTPLQLIERGQADQVLGALATDYEGAPS